MNEDHQNRAPTNKWVGERIGYSESGASLLRRGLRAPTLPLMGLVKNSLGWSIEDQAKAHEDSSWAAQFEDRMRAAYALELTTTTTEENK